MRLRNVKGAEEIIANSLYVIQDPGEYKGKWNTFFGNDHPIHIEIGMGKGKFVHTLAELHPEINYIGIEMYSSVLCRAIEKRQEKDLPNLYFIRMDAKKIIEVFDEDEIDRIYLNFSDPWPKESFLLPMILFSIKTVLSALRQITAAFLTTLLKPLKNRNIGVSGTLLMICTTVLLQQIM